MFCGGVQFYPVQSEMSNKSSLFISMFCNLLWNPTPKSSNPGHGGGNPQNEYKFIGNSLFHFKTISFCLILVH